MFLETKQKLRRANQHLNNLKGAIGLYIASDPCIFRLEKLNEIGHYTLFGKLNRMPRHIWGLWVGDCVHNARSALDYSIYELSRLPSSSRFRHRLQFPICGNPLNFKAACDGHRIDGLSGTASNIIESNQPYNNVNGSADDPFSLLRAISDSDKHHTSIIAVAGGINTRSNAGGLNLQIDGNGKIALGDVCFIDQANSLNMSERETAVAEVYLHPQANFNLQLRLFPRIQFGKYPRDLAGYDVVMTLSQIIKKIQNTISQLEETSRNEVEVKILSHSTIK